MKKKVTLDTLVEIGSRSSHQSYSPSGAPINGYDSPVCVSIDFDE